MTRANIFYSGRVQGVGFRFTIQQYAADLDLCGWVKNLPDGRVEAIVEGEREIIEELCRKIDGHFAGYIRHKNIDFFPARGDYHDFQIVL